MADSSPLNGLLDRAQKAFAIAGEFGRWLEEANKPDYEPDPTGQRQKLVRRELQRWFQEFAQAAVDCGALIESVPEGYEEVAEVARALAEWAATWEAKIEKDQTGNAWLWLSSDGPNLLTFEHNGFMALKRVKDPSKRQRWEFLSPKALDSVHAQATHTQVEDAMDDQEQDQKLLTQLEEFPATPSGHVAFIELVRDEVHFAADAKRNQFAEKYSNATIESMVRGIKWIEARARIALLSDLPADALEQVERVLRRELTIGTVGQISGLLTPAVGTLRDALELYRETSSRQPELATLLDVAREADQADHNERVRKFWIQFGMPADLTYEQGKAWAQAKQSRMDAADSAWRNKVVDLERLIETRCRKRMLAAGFRDDEMRGEYIPCLPPNVDASDPRDSAFRAAFHEMKLDEKAKARVLGCVPVDEKPQDDVTELGRLGPLPEVRGGPSDGAAKSVEPMSIVQPAEPPSASVVQPRPIKLPSKKAWQVWHIYRAGTTKQADIAATMTANGRPATQGEVSRWLREVRDFINGGGRELSGDEVGAMPDQAVTWDSATLDLGQRVSGEQHRPEHQRPGHEPDSDE